MSFHRANIFVPTAFLSKFYFQPENRHRFKEIRAGTIDFKFNLEVKFFYLIRFLLSHCIRPEYYVQICQALTEYAVDFPSRMSLCSAFDHITRGTYQLYIFLEILYMMFHVNF